MQEILSGHMQPNGDDTSGEILSQRKSLVLRLRPSGQVIFNCNELTLHMIPDGAPTYILQGIDNINNGRLKELVSVLRGAKEGFLTRGGTQSSHL